MKKTSGRKIFQYIISPFLYFGLTLAMVVNVFIYFNQHYYLTIYVDGESMKPTLNNNTTIVTSAEGEWADKLTKQEKAELAKHDGYLYKYVNFGYVDRHKDAINKIKRLDIITTYYPWDVNDYPVSSATPYQHDMKPLETAAYKIKRVIAIPGDTFKIVDSVVWLKENDEWSELKLPFNPSIDRDVPEKVVGENEYWVAGDNWGNSSDSFDHPSLSGGKSQSPIYYENITGVLIAIQGECTMKKYTTFPLKEAKYFNHTYYKKPIYQI